MAYHLSVVLKLLTTLADRCEEAGRHIDKDKYSTLHPGNCVC